MRQIYIFVCSCASVSWKIKKCEPVCSRGPWYWNFYLGTSEGLRLISISWFT